MRDNTMPKLGLAAGALMISFSAVFVKLVQLDPVVSGFYRLFFGALALGLMVPLARHRCSMDMRVTLLAAVAGFLFACDISAWHRSILYAGKWFGRGNRYNDGYYDDTDDPYPHSSSHSTR
jgi:hypothetical protein